MKQHRKEELIAGAVVIGGVTLLCLLIAVVTGRISWGSARNVQVVFDDVRGLKKGDPVFFHGVPCGRVSSVHHEKRAWRELWPAEPPGEHVKVVLDLEVDGEIGAFMKTASKVTVEKTITGITAVIIREGTGEPLQPGSVLEGDPGTAIEELAAEAQSVGKSLNELIGEVRAVVEEVHGDGRLVKIIASIHETAANLEAATASMRSLVNESIEPWKTSLANVEDTTGRVAETVREIQPAAKALVTESAPRLSSILESVEAVTSALAPHAAGLGEALAALPQATRDIGAATAELRALLTRNRHRLDGSVRDVSLAAENVAAATAEIRRQPWRLLYRPDAEECSTLGILDAVREYSLATGRLERTFEELLILNQGPPELKVLTQQALEDARGALGRYQETEAALWAELKR